LVTRQTRRTARNGKNLAGPTAQATVGGSQTAWTVSTAEIDELEIRIEAVQDGMYDVESIAVAWQNERGLIGAWSEIQSAVIP
jgi:hypothetical protein